MQRHKTFYMLIVVAAATAFIAACGSEEPASETEAESEAQTEAESESDSDSESDTEADTVSAASVVDTAEAFMASTNADGTWIVAVTEDLSIDEEVVIDGEFTRRDEIYRKIALYAQDDDRNITDRYTLSAPRLTVNSPNTRIQGGTFVGDVYVQAPDFHVYDATIDGDVYFEDASYESTFSLQEGGEVTGETAISD
ncbi:MAG: hypothetical protein ACQETQ_07820 [Spirochaetota bacterium]